MRSTGVITDVMCTEDENKVNERRGQRHENGPRARDGQRRVNGHDREGDDAHEAYERRVLLQNDGHDGEEREQDPYRQASEMNVSVKEVATLQEQEEDDGHEQTAGEENDLEYELRQVELGRERRSVRRREREREIVSRYLVGEHAH